MAILLVDGLHAGYGKIHVLYGISLELRPKEILSVVGPNGSGKSTLLKAIFGLSTIHSGRVYFEDRDITFMPPHIRAKLGLAYLPQVDKLFERLTVYENLLMAGYTVPGDVFNERVEDALSFLPQMKGYLDRKVYTLSGGERQMVAMAMALIRNPKVILMDEPTAALAPKVASQIIDKIVDLRDEYGMGVLLVEQNARKALEIGDKALLLVAGRQVFRGTPEGLLGNPDMSKLYLGIR